jgi:hypothetical protein
MARWRVDIIRARLEHLGSITAPTESLAITRAAEQFHTRRLGGTGSLSRRSATGTTINLSSWRYRARVVALCCRSQNAPAAIPAHSHASLVSAGRLNPPGAISGGFFFGGYIGRYIPGLSHESQNTTAFGADPRERSDSIGRRERFCRGAPSEMAGLSF